jgi:hypothetical protein
VVREKDELRRELKVSPATHIFTFHVETCSMELGESLSNFSRHLEVFWRSLSHRKAMNADIFQNDHRRRVVRLVEQPKQSKHIDLPLSMGKLLTLVITRLYHQLIAESIAFLAELCRTYPFQCGKVASFQPILPMPSFPGRRSASL